MNKNCLLVWDVKMILKAKDTFYISVVDIPLCICIFSSIPLHCIVCTLIPQLSRVSLLRFIAITGTQKDTLKWLTHISSGAIATREQLIQMATSYYLARLTCWLAEVEWYIWLWLASTLLLPPPLPPTVLRRTIIIVQIQWLSTLR